MSDFGSPRDEESRLQFYFASLLFEILNKQGYNFNKKKQRKEACAKVQHCLQILTEFDGTECHEMVAGGIGLIDEGILPQDFLLEGK